MLNEQVPRVNDILFAQVMSNSFSVWVVPQLQLPSGDGTEHICTQSCITGLINFTTLKLDFTRFTLLDFQFQMEHTHGSYAILKTSVYVCSHRLLVANQAILTKSTYCCTKKDPTVLIQGHIIGDINAPRAARNSVRILRHPTQHKSRLIIVGDRIRFLGLKEVSIDIKTH